MIDKVLDIKDLNIGKTYRYQERDIGCVMFAEVFIRKLSFVNDHYKVECDILKDLGSDPKLDLEADLMSDYLTLGYQKDNRHYFKGVFYDAVEIEEEKMNDDYDAEIKLYELTKVKVGWPIYGYIYNDKRRRFGNGEQVNTSIVLEHDEVNDIVKTRNTTYKILKSEDE